MTVFFTGLDLGQAHDYTALAVAQQFPDPAGARYEVSWLQRFALGTPYPAIVTNVAELLRRIAAQATRSPPEPGSQYADRAYEGQGVSQALVVDATGVGRPVIDMLRRESLPATRYDVTITGGDRVQHEGNAWRVPKRELVSTVQVLLQAKRLGIAQQLPEAATLSRELLNFQVKISDTAHDRYGAWREGTHDDLVLAVALAVWCGERGQPRARVL